MRNYKGKITKPRQKWLFWKKYILPVLVLFLVVNISIVIASFEGWFQFECNKFILFLLFFVKVVVLCGITVLLLVLFNLDEHPLVLAGLIMSIMTVFLSNVHITDFQRAYFQKQTVGGAVEITNTSLIDMNTLRKTPYLHFKESSIGKIASVSLHTGFSNDGSRRESLYTLYCYAQVSHPRQQIYLYEKCDQGKGKYTGLKELTGKTEVYGELLSRRSPVNPRDNVIQLGVTEKSFEEYYMVMARGLKKMLYIVNGIALLFVGIFWLFASRSQD